MLVPNILPIVHVQRPSELIPLIPDETLENYAASLPYPVESNEKMQATLDFILSRLTRCLEVRDYIPGFRQWDRVFFKWLMLKYPISKEKRIKIIKVYFHACTTAAMPLFVVYFCSETLRILFQTRPLLCVEDLRLPWKPVYDLLTADMRSSSKSRRDMGGLPLWLGILMEETRKYAHPAAIGAVLDTIVPTINGTSTQSLLCTQYYLLNFLPLSHPQLYLPMLFRMWESVTSIIYDGRMLEFLARLAIRHLDPSLSDPKKIASIPDDERSVDEERPEWSRLEVQDDHEWLGIYKDIGIFTEDQWNSLMCRGLTLMEIPLADSGSTTTGNVVDDDARNQVERLPKADDGMVSLARIIVYSMSPDGPATPSHPSTPLFTPLPSGMNTPHLRTGAVKDVLSIPLSSTRPAPTRAYLGGCRALDSLAKLVASVEVFFQPSSSGGRWTEDLSIFLNKVVILFNRRWHEEQKPDCKTPPHRRLTKQIKSELVKALRTMALLAIFSDINAVVSNAQEALRNMCLLEPELILHPILERAVPSLEAVTEPQRAIAIIRALEAVTTAFASRKLYYPGAKFLVPILQLVNSAIDMNEPMKTFRTAEFISSIAQLLKFDDLTVTNSSESNRIYAESSTSSTVTLLLPSSHPDESAAPGSYLESQVNREEEDALLRDTTGSFADWVTSFVRQFIQLLENLPGDEENISGTSALEVGLIDAVSEACGDVCAHLSDSLYDLVLNLVFDYASTNVRPTAVPVISRLVSCVAKANPAKSLAKFFPFCVRVIRRELDHGAISLRISRSTTPPRPSDATLHWNLNILLGVTDHDGKALLPYRTDLLALFRTLHDKAFSEDGFYGAGRLVARILCSLTSTYPLDTRFVNPDEWESKEFRESHHLVWGKLYELKDIKIAWHTPNSQELDFAMEILKELVEPTIGILDCLLKDGIVQDEDWRNDFCRHLTFVRAAFEGIANLVVDTISPKSWEYMKETSNTPENIPEMIELLEPVESGFCLTDPTDPRAQYVFALRHRFGNCLNKASAVLRKQGDEKIVDAVSVLIDSLHTYFSSYSANKDGFNSSFKQYLTLLNRYRQHPGQKIWPRRVLVMLARTYHLERMRWNSYLRCRGPLEDKLIDDVIEWSLCRYSMIRKRGQAVLEYLTRLHDGIRKRALPVLYKALQCDKETDRIQGALETIRIKAIGLTALQDPSQARELWKNLFACQRHTESTVQTEVGNTFELCIGTHSEPDFLVHKISNASLNRAVGDLQALLSDHPRVESSPVAARRTICIRRVQMAKDTMNILTSDMLKIAQASETHWIYRLYAVTCLRFSVSSRRDVPLPPSLVTFFFDALRDYHPVMRYHAHMGVIRSLSYIRLKTLCRDARELALLQAHNPLEEIIPIEASSHHWVTEFLQNFREPTNESGALSSLVCEPTSAGWFSWKREMTFWRSPDPMKSTYQPWEEDSQPVIEAVRSIVTDQTFWSGMLKHYEEKNYEKLVNLAHVNCVRQIFKIFDDEPLEALRPVIEKYMEDNEQNRQRAVAEVLAGVLRGSVFWPTTARERLWQWLMPYLRKVLSEFITNETLETWCSFLHLVSRKQDPRDLRPLIDHLWAEFNAVDLHSESLFDAIKILHLVESFAEGFGWKFTAWAKDSIERFWPEIHNEHRNVRKFVGVALLRLETLVSRPKPSIPRTEQFIKECSASPPDFDILGTRGTCLTSRVLEVADRFTAWRDQRLPGVLAVQSEYDRVGSAICEWLLLSLHNVWATRTFDYILPLLPHLFQFTEARDNPDLAAGADELLTQMCGVTPPKALVVPILDAILEAVQFSPSWRIRSKALPLVQIFYFRQLPLFNDENIVKILEVLCLCLDDEIVEVREQAAVILSGILRLSPRRSVLSLKDRFVRLVKASRIPSRQAPDYNEAIRRRHAAILGVCALVESYPHTVEDWMPDLLTNVLAEHIFDPIPISTSVGKCAGNFRKTHHDTWNEDRKKFNESQLAALSTLLTGFSYYA